MALSQVMIVAGEASGDLHGANLVRAARTLAPDLEFFGMGGEMLRQTGVELLVDLEHMSLMGISEIFAKLGHALDALKRLKAALVDRRPAALVLIDYPDFNLRLAKAAYQVGVPVFYFISPQVWAWRRGRVKQIARWVTRMAVVFPFELPFYQAAGVDVEFVGHPLLDILQPPRPKTDVKAQLGLDPNRPLLGLFPGSRKPLVAELLPVLLDTAKILRAQNADLNIAIARADTLSADFMAPFLEQGPSGVTVFAGQSHALQNASDLAVSASGTCTLEMALMLTPMVVVYRMRPLSYLVGRMLVQVDHVSLANLVAGRRVVPELLQNEARPDRIAAELRRIMSEPGAREEMVNGLRQVRAKLGRPGAGLRAARMLLKTMGRDVPLMNGMES